MKFLRDQSFKRLSWYILGVVALVFIGEFFLIVNSIGRYHDSEVRKDLARTIQLETQELKILTQKLGDRTEALTNDVASRIDRINHHLTLLKDGGRIDGSNNFIDQLSRLPMITFANVDESWQKYRGSIMVLLTEEALIDSTIVLQPDPADTVNQSPYTTEIQFTNTRYKAASTLMESQAASIASWYQKLIVDIEDETKSAYSGLTGIIFWLLIIDIIVLAAIVYLFNIRAIIPLKKLALSIASRKKQENPSHDEVGALAKTTNDLLVELEDASSFVAMIGEGKLDGAYTQRSNSNGASTDSLAQALVAMQGKLRAMNDEEKKRQWANEGISRFVDILRSSDDNISRLGDEIIAALVKYTNSNQGGLYILNDDDEHKKFLELVAMFAFDSKKFQKQTIRLGEGVLGQTFLEKETTMLTEIPDDYVRITSGLGEGGPKALLMVPLKVDQNVYGMVELASFNEYKPHEIAFVEKLGETIASTLASVKAAQKNKHLIEQFQQQTEEMRAQEEEMRQNMEELTATQEEMSRKERDYVDRIRELEGNEGDTLSAHELQRTKDELNNLRQQHASQLEQLQQKLDSKPVRSDDWAIAEEVERTLKTNLEALKITQEELTRKAAEN